MLGIDLSAIKLAIAIEYCYAFLTPKEDMMEGPKDDGKANLASRSYLLTSATPGCLYHYHCCCSDDDLRRGGMSSLSPTFVPAALPHVRQVADLPWMGCAVCL